MLNQGNPLRLFTESCCCNWQRLGCSARRRPRSWDLGTQPALPRQNPPQLDSSCPAPRSSSRCRQAGGKLPFPRRRRLPAQTLLSGGDRTRGDGRRLGTGRPVRRGKSHRPLSEPQLPLPLAPRRSSLPSAAFGIGHAGGCSSGLPATDHTLPPPGQRCAPCACALSSTSSWVIPHRLSEGRGGLRK